VNPVGAGGRAERRGPPRAAAALLPALALSLGCQTLRSFEKGCPDVYSGARFYGDQIGTLPLDGQIFFTLDLPLTLVADTLLLPATAFAEPSDRPEGFPPGCRWADRSRR
jgi:uncharacterized protein YceK